MQLSLGSVTVLQADAAVLVLGIHPRHFRTTGCLGTVEVASAGGENPCGCAATSWGAAPPLRCVLRTLPSLELFSPSLVLFNHAGTLHLSFRRRRWRARPFGMLLPLKLPP